MLLLLTLSLLVASSSGGFLMQSESFVQQNLLPRKARKARLLSCGGEREKHASRRVQSVFPPQAARQSM